MNSIHIIGNLTAVPILKEVGQTHVADFSIAVNEVWYNDAKEKQERTHFFNCVAWGRLGENIAKFFTKGQKIALDGSLAQETWEKDGQKRSTVKIRVSGFDFCGDKKPQGEGSEQRQPANAGKSAPAKDPDLDAEEDDIPF